jgi:hypothetical protein
MKYLNLISYLLLGSGLSGLDNNSLSKKYIIWEDCNNIFIDDLINYIDIVINERLY